MSADTEPTTLRLDAEDGFAGTAIAARWVGERMPRTEDQRMITGHGRYVDDLAKPGMVHATFVRSAVASGRIVELDVSEARRAPGVVAVLTAAEISSRIRPFAPGPVDKTPRRLLADGDVRYVGEPIAIVVAESRYLAEDAAELVSVDIEPGEAVVTAAQALAEGSPRVHPELPDNLSGVVPAEDLPGLDVLFENAPHVFTETFPQHRYVCVPMETHGTVAEWDPWTGQLELNISGHGVHSPRLLYSRMLGIPEDDIRVIMGDVGGSFGQKISPTREDQAIVVAAVVIGGLPVKWIEDRAENLISGGHAREESLQITAATDENGVLLAARAHHLENVGAYPNGTNGQKAGLASRIFPGPYHWSGPGSVAYSGQALYTNTCGTCAYRGPWMMETTGREQMVDVVAQKLGIDPLEFRRRNVISRSELPYKNPMSMVYAGISPAGVPGAGGRADRLRAVPQGAGAGPRVRPPARHRAVPVHRAPAGPRRLWRRGRHHPGGAQRQGQRVYGHRQSRAEHRDHHDPDHRRRDGCEHRRRPLHPGRHGLHPVRSRRGRQPDGRRGPAGRRTWPARRCASGCSRWPGRCSKSTPATWR